MQGEDKPARDAWQGYALRFAADEAASYFRHFNVPQLIAYYEIYPYKRELEERAVKAVGDKIGPNISKGAVRLLLHKCRPQLNALIFGRLGMGNETIETDATPAADTPRD